MVTTGQFGHHTTVLGVNIDLGVQRIRQQTTLGVIRATPSHRSWFRFPVLSFRPFLQHSLNITPPTAHSRFACYAQLSRPVLEVILQSRRSCGRLTCQRPLELPYHADFLWLPDRPDPKKGAKTNMSQRFAK